MNDLRLALRALRRTPSFAIVAGAALAIGIGANTAVFSVVNGVLLRPLPYADEARVVRVFNRWEGSPRASISPAEYFDYLDQTTEVLADFGVWSTGSLNLTGDGQPERVAAAFATAGAMRALRVEPLRGRIFSETEDAAGAAPVALLSHELWRRRYGDRTDIVGTDINVNGTAVTVIGILPADFLMPTDYAGTKSLLILAQGLDRATATARGSHYLNGIARLAGGVSVQQADARLAAVASGMAATYPDDYPRDMRFGAYTMGIRQDIAGNVRPVLLVLLGAVGLMLLVACANVAGLTLARADARGHEFAIRRALGAGRAHVVRQLLAESSVLSVLGGVAGVIVATWGVNALIAIQPQSLPQVQGIGVDLRVLGFASCVTLLTAVLFGLAPLSRSGSEPASALRESGRGATAGRSRQRFRQSLVAGEIALSVVLLAGAGLLVRSMVLLLSVDPGYATTGVLTTRVNLPGSTYGSDQRRRDFFEQMTARTAALPGVTAAGAVTNLPLTGTLGDLNFRVEGRPVPEGQVSPRMDWQVITPGYFEAMGMRLVAGRPIEPRDDAGAPGVVVINEAGAQLHFPGENAIGKRFTLGGRAGPGLVEVIGIVADIRHSGLRSDPVPEMYLAHKQFRFWNGGNAVNAMTLVVRTDGPPSALAPSIRSALATLDPELPAGAFQTMEDVKSASVAQPRFVMVLLAIFAVVAVVLAAVGIYGMISFNVGLRMKEIGVRMALGARSSQVLSLVLRQGLTSVGLGLAAGITAALLLTRLLSGLLFGVEPGDPLTLVAVVAVLSGTAAAACIAPVRRAVRVDPVVTLRTD